MNYESQTVQQERRQRQNTGKTAGGKTQSGAGSGETLAEEWRPIAGYEGFYEVSNMGNVRSVTRYRISKGGGKQLLKGRVLKHGLDRGYRILRFKCPIGRSTLRLGRVVALAFIENPENKPTVNHINSVRDDDRVTNLEWATQSEQLLHAFKSGFAKPIRKHSESLVLQIKHFISDGMRNCEIASRLGVNKSLVNNIKNGNQWKTLCTKNKV